MEDEATQVIGEWISHLARGIHADGYNNIQSLRMHPVLLRIADALDAHGPAYAGELEDADDTPHYIEACGNQNGSSVFHYSISEFAHRVHLPIRRASAAPAPAMRQDLREHAVTVHRCFRSLRGYCKWKKQKRHGLIKGLLFWRGRTLRNAMRQWNEFMIKRRVSLLTSCFSSWRTYCTKKKRYNDLILQANNLTSKVRLSKAVVAWKHFVRKMRRERSRQFFIENRHNLLTAAHWFERWLTSFQQHRMLSIVIRREKIRILESCLREWKVMAARSKIKRTQISQANSYHRYNQVTKTWRKWIRFADTSIQKKLIARQAVARCLARFCFKKWLAHLHNNRRWKNVGCLLVERTAVIRRSYYIQKWRAALYTARARRRAIVRFILKRTLRRWSKYCKLMKRLALQKRAAHLYFLNNKFVRWKAWTRARKQSRAAVYYFALCFFRRWYNATYEKQHMRELEHMARGFYFHRTAPFIIRRSINTWKRYIAYQRHRRRLLHHADLYHVGCVVPKKLARCIAAWKNHTTHRKASRAKDQLRLQEWNKIRLRNAFSSLVRRFTYRKLAKERKYMLRNRLQNFVRRKYILLIHTCFRKWRAHVMSVAFFKTSLATSHFTQTTLEKCFLAWVKFTKRRVMAHIASVVYRTTKLRRSFETWKEALEEQRIKWQIAELYNKQHLLTLAFTSLRRYNNFAKQTAELKIYPLVRKREYCTQAMAFYKWTAYVGHSTTKKDFEMQAFKSWVFHRLSDCFRKWKEFCSRNKRQKLLHKSTKRPSYGKPILTTRATITRQLKAI